MIIPRYRSLVAIKDPQREPVALQGVELKSDLVAAQVAARRTFIRPVYAFYYISL